jgi:hypothetical protein
VCSFVSQHCRYDGVCVLARDKNFAVNERRWRALFATRRKAEQSYAAMRVCHRYAAATDLRLLATFFARHVVRRGAARCFALVARAGA